MAHLNVQFGDKWASFSTVTDGFLTEFMDFEAYRKWLSDRNTSAIEPRILPRNTIQLMEAAENVRRNRLTADAVFELSEIGISKEEAIEIIRQVETKNYKPRPVSPHSDEYFCPNCKSSVSLGQKECSEESCEITFIWNP